MPSPPPVPWCLPPQPSQVGTPLLILQTCTQQSSDLLSSEPTRAQTDSLSCSSAGITAKFNQWCPRAHPSSAWSAASLPFSPSLIQPWLLVIPPFPSATPPWLREMLPFAAPTELRRARSASTPVRMHPGPKEGAAPHQPPHMPCPWSDAIRLHRLHHASIPPSPSLCPPARPPRHRRRRSPPLTVELRHRPPRHRPPLPHEP